jgi:cell fate regulator YaaT (PSP1 superfamily)
MQNIVEIEYRSGNSGYCINIHNLDIKPEMRVIVNAERGEDIVKVVSSSVKNENVEESGKIETNILRIATQEDFEKLTHVIESEDEAVKKFNELLVKYPFEMKLIDTVYQFDGNKLTFFFTADGRVDFRMFVRELASYFRTRIELHQTSGRDQAKRLGGIGMCGHEYCCSTFLRKFNQVTIKMAKDQNLSSNLSKISGPCGRLLCCLNYEENSYLEEHKGFPEVGDRIKYNKNEMYVYKIDYFNKKIHLTDDDRNFQILDLEQYKSLSKKRYGRR